MKSELVLKLNKLKSIVYSALLYLSVFGVIGLFATLYNQKRVDLVNYSDQFASEYVDNFCVKNKIFGCYRVGSRVRVELMSEVERLYVLSVNSVGDYRLWSLSSVQQHKRMVANLREKLSTIENDVADFIGNNDIIPVDSLVYDHVIEESLTTKYNWDYLFVILSLGLMLLIWVASVTVEQP